eukprot:CAMPEP_0181118976 /NCGR_PEP_ID=MMETSP1071-20121207/23361_1 /TAXON_ID=35127 /ORGANISM="Thalassiosira sp., Strain NH16" /LENGTH=736 /DNA_ID=CAMNT_0023203503 /DNA_START=536 /DNA_END=2746 /DNA_ORIENTATION=+
MDHQDHININRSASSSSEGSPGFPRLSLPRTSSHATACDDLSLSSQAVYASWEQSEDIRGDLDAGWGEGMSAARLSGSGRHNAMDDDARTSDNNNMDEDQQEEEDDNDPWTWRLRDRAVRPVPSFYPMDPRATRKLPMAGRQREGVREEEGSGGMMTAMEGVQKIGAAPSSASEEVRSVGEISRRISDACQKLSIQGHWNNGLPSATLFSMERVEMEISLYYSEAASASSQELLVELQRRKGCSVTFHTYRRHLLDAAEGKFDPDSFDKTDGLHKPLGRDRCNQPRASLGRPGLARPSPSGGGPARPDLARPQLSSGGSGGIARPGIARPQLSSGGSMGIARPGLARPGLAKPSPSVGMSDIARPAPFSMGGEDSMARPSLRSPSFSADDASVPIAGLKTEGDEAMVPPTEDTKDKAMKALNMAASLIRKDRVDARRLGMESLVLLTDPLRAGVETAMIASRVVLLGSASEETHFADDDGIDALFDESSGLGIRETILEMIMTDGEEKTTGDEDSHGGFELFEKEFTDSIFNLCLTVLSNALHTIEESVKMSPGEIAQQAQDEQSDDGDRKPSPRRRAATEPAVSKKFIDETKSAFGVDVLSSLIRILGQARTNPHDAYHSARCLGVLFKGCGNSHKARARRDLDAKRIISAALEVGSRSHAKLADASRVAMVALVTDDEGSMEEEEEEERTRLQSPRGGLEGTEVDVEGTQQEQEHCELPSVMEQSQSGDSDDAR